MIDESHNDEIFSGNKNITEIFNNYFVNMDITYGEKFSDSFALKEYMSSTDVSESYKFSTKSLESLETIIGSLIKSSLGYD